MIVEINENGTLVLKEVFNSIVLESQDGERLAICMRDTGFELDYMTETLSQLLELKKGQIVWCPKKS